MRAGLRARWRSAVDFARPRFARALAVARGPGWGWTLAPLALPFALAPWLGVAMWNFVQGHIYLDSTMFLYVAWCVRHGERLYQTIAQPDGPFVTIVHLVLLGLGGISESGFRKADIEVHATLAAVMGAVLVPPRASHPVASRVVWAIAASVLWLAFLFHWGQDESCQRESYYSLFACLGFALLVAGGDLGRWGARVALPLGGLCVGLPMFGKPTFVVFAVAALGALALDRPPPGGSRWRRLGLAGSGVLVAAGSMLGFVALFGSLRGYVFWQREYVGNFYYYMNWRPLLDVFRDAPRDLATPALMCFAGGIAAIGGGLLPTRALAAVVAPAMALAAGVLPRKGWTYHYIPVSAMVQGFLIIALVRAWHAAGPLAEATRRAPGLVVALAGYVSMNSFDWAQTSPWLDKKERQEDAEEVKDSRGTADFLRTHTLGSARVFFTGRDPGAVLFAPRRPATPYFVPWLVGGGNGAYLGEEVPAADKERALALKTRLMKDLCWRLTTHPATAIAVRNGWCAGQDCVAEISASCPDFAELVKTQYLEPQRFGSNAVYLLKN